MYHTEIEEKGQASGSSIDDRHRSVYFARGLQTLGAPCAPIGVRNLWAGENCTEVSTGLASIGPLVW